MISRRQFLFGSLAAGAGLCAPVLGMRLERDHMLSVAADLYGETGSFVVREWFSLLDELHKAGLEQQMKAVNDFFNE